MASANDHLHHRRIHPVHGVILAGALPLFLGKLLSDWAYSSTFEVQWINFAAWLLAGTLVLAGAALLWAAIDSSARTASAILGQRCTCWS